jgi:hypothetical protein
MRGRIGGMECEPGDSAPLPDIQWPTPFKSSERLPDAKALVFAWKPLIDGWDIVLGRHIIASPDQFTHWLPMLPAPVQ